MQQRWRFDGSKAVSVAVCSLFVACGSSDGGGGGAAAALTPFTPPSVGNNAAIVVNNAPLSPGDTKSTLIVNAYFYDRPDGNLSDRYGRDGKKATCQRATSGACVLVVCDYADDPSQKYGKATYRSPGELTMRRAADTQPTKIPFNSGNNAYDFRVESPPPFASAETISFAASGETVPAFTTMVTFGGSPEQVTPPEGGSITVKRGAGVDIAWSGVTGGKVRMQLRDDTVTTKLRELLCDFEGAPGKGTIPGDLLQSFDAGSKVTGVLFGSPTIVKAGAWDVEVSVGQSTKGPSTNGRNGFDLVFE